MVSRYKRQCNNNDGEKNECFEAEEVLQTFKNFIEDFAATGCAIVPLSNIATPAGKPFEPPSDPRSALESANLQ